MYTGVNARKSTGRFIITRHRGGEEFAEAAAVFGDQLSMVGCPVCSILLKISTPNEESEWLSGRGGASVS